MKNFTTFKHKYLLVEDSANTYQPFFKEYVKTPELSLDTPPFHCPFQKNKVAKSGSKKKTPKSGFCEVCCVKFANYNEHVKEYEHREFATDNCNYSKIDVLISEAEFCNYNDVHEFGVLPSSPLDKFANSVIIGDCEKIYNKILHVSKIISEETSTSQGNCSDLFLSSIAINTSK